MSPSFSESFFSIRAHLGLAGLMADWRFDSQWAIGLEDLLEAPAMTSQAAGSEIVIDPAAIAPVATAPGAVYLARLAPRLASITQTSTQRPKLCA